MDFSSFILALIALAIGIRSLNKISGLQGQVTRLKMELAVFLQKQNLQTAGVSQPAAAAETQIAPEAIIETIAPAKEAPVETLVKDQAPNVLPSTTPPRDMERAIASRWFVWIGGIAIAIGGLLFVKYAFDVGLISPTFQIFLGLAAAATLIFAGHRLRANTPTESDESYVPAALSAAGLVTAFGSVYASYALYDLVSPGTAFIGLGIIALGAFYLARFQGPLIAALGLIGAMATPMLIPSENPSAWGFFIYLFVIIVAAFFTLRAQKWWWLGYAALTGALAWSVLWMVGGPLFQNGDIIPIGLFAIGSAFAAAILPTGRSVFWESSGSLLNPSSMNQGLRLATFGMAAEAGILSTLVSASNHHGVAVFFFAIGMAGIVAFGWVKRGWSFAPVLAALFSWVVLMGWPGIAFHELAMDERGLWSTVQGQIAPYEFRDWMAIGLASFTSLGLFGLWRKTPPQVWAGLASGSAIAFLFGTWARVNFVFSDSWWAILAAALAFILCAAIWWRKSLLHEEAQNISSGLLLSGATLLLVFMYDRLLDGVWLSLALAALAAVIAFSTKAIAIHWSGKVVSLLAGFVALRLFAAREFWTAQPNLPWGDHWPLYGYGVPVVLFLLASRVLHKTNHARSAMALEGVSLGLAVSLISLELRVLIGGGVTSDELHLLEVSTHILSWLGAAYGLAYRQHLFSSFVSLWGARILLAISCFAIATLSLVYLNPVLSNEIIIGKGFFNSLILAYLAPVILLALIARKLDGIGWGHLRNAIGVFALVLLFTYVTLETKHVFQGPLLSMASSMNEFYAYSLVWLLLALGLFLAGIKMARQSVRYGGLAIMILVVLKVFLADLSDLDGLLRIMSFVGLGLCLVGMGWVYTKHVAPPKEAAIQS